MQIYLRGRATATVSLCIFTNIVNITNILTNIINILINICLFKYMLNLHIGEDSQDKEVISSSVIGQSKKFTGFNV